MPSVSEWFAFSPFYHICIIIHQVPNTSSSPFQLLTSCEVPCIVSLPFPVNIVISFFWWLLPFPFYDYLILLYFALLSTSISIASHLPCALSTYYSLDLGGLVIQKPQLCIHCHLNQKPNSRHSKSYNRHQIAHQTPNPSHDATRKIPETYLIKNMPRIQGKLSKLQVQPQIQE